MCIRITRIDERLQRNIQQRQALSGVFENPCTLDAGPAFEAPLVSQEPIGVVAEVPESFLEVVGHVTASGLEKVTFGAEIPRKRDWQEKPPLNGPP